MQRPLPVGTAEIAVSGRIECQTRGTLATAVRSDWQLGVGDGLEVGVVVGEHDGGRGEGGGGFDDEEDGMRMS